MLLSEILRKHIDSHLLYLHYQINTTLQSWLQYHHSQCWSKLKCHLSILFFFYPKNNATKIIVLIIVYGKAFFHPYFCHRYKSLVYLVLLKLSYSYSYRLHILLLFAWMLFFDTCPCLDCCLVLDLACITSLNITLMFSVVGQILFFFCTFEVCFHNFSLKLVLTWEVLTGFGISLVQLGSLIWTLHVYEGPNFFVSHYFKRFALIIFLWNFSWLCNDWQTLTWYGL